MTRVYFSTVERGGTSKGAGEFILVDFDTKKLRQSACSPDRSQDGRSESSRRWTWGTRHVGRRRPGLRGKSRSDPHLRPRPNELSSVSNGLLVGAHEVYMERSGFLWVAATNADAVLEISLENGDCARSYWPREDPRLQDSLGLTAMELDKTIDNRALLVAARQKLQDPSHIHLNAVGSWKGEMHALFNELGVIVNLDQGRVVIEDKMLHLGHNLVVVDDQLFTDSTQFRMVCQFDLPSGRMVRSIAVEDLPWVRKLAKSVAGPRLGRLSRKKVRPRPGGVAMPLFARGLQVVGDIVYVGIAPATILCIDWPRGELIDSFQYSTEVNVAVHGLQVVTGN